MLKQMQSNIIHKLSSLPKRKRKRKRYHAQTAFSKDWYRVGFLWVQGLSNGPPQFIVHLWMISHKCHVYIEFI